MNGRPVALTRLDRVVYPATGTTKADVIAYYLGVAGAMLPHLSGRPVTRRRWPDGVDAPGFYERNVPAWAPDWLRTVDLPHGDGPVTYPVARERADLVWFAQSGALELHTPQWRVGARGARRPPDRLVLDLDPGAPAALAECARLARWLRTRLRADGVESVPVTSGSKGIQLYARWPPGRGRQPEAAGYARELAREVTATFPAEVVATMTRSERAGKVLVDWSQNNPAKTTIAPYSLRGTSRPAVAAPRRWDELERDDLAQLTPAEVLDRVRNDDDPIAGWPGTTEEDA